MEENSNEVRVFGPPGTGKTTWVASSVKATAETRGTSRIAIASFTRAAATEIAGRGLPLDRQQVGTLHALAYRAIGRPTLFEEHVDDWNETERQYALSVGFKGSRIDGAIDPAGATRGDEMLLEVDSLRARGRARSTWPFRAVHFSDKWEAWKKKLGLIDFTDMIELALEKTEHAPGDPVVFYADEVQDFTPLELGLVRHWGRHCERVILAGDDDQCIYGFKGAVPEAFLDPPLPDSQKRILSQSYRVPRTVHAMAERWVHQLAKREPKEYLPRDADGAVRRMNHCQYRDPKMLAREVAHRVDAGKTVMVMGACAYMIDPLKHELRRLGLPFHNPYRRARSDWNPLRPSRGVSSAEKLVAYLILDERLFGEMSRLWTGKDVRAWASVMKKQGVFCKGANSLISGLPDRELSFEEVARLFDDEQQLEEALTPSLEWFQRNLLANNKEPMMYPINIVQRSGPLALVEEPRCIIGTIHSQKGSEADSVFLLPDVSVAGMNEWQSPDRDSVIRQFYVGMTRAREELVICGPSGEPSLAGALHRAI